MKRKSKPQLKWQSGHYAPVQEFHFRLPYPFLLLCKLWDTTPLEVLTDFMDNLGCGPVNRQHREDAKQHLQQYIFEMTYGQQLHYNLQDLKNMFAELDIIGSILSQHDTGTIKQPGQYQEVFYNQWFTKWTDKSRSSTYEQHDE